MAKLTDAEARLLLEPNFAVVATQKPDGKLQSSVVWIDYDGENVVFNTRLGRAKPRHLERNPCVSVTVIDMQDPYRYVEVEGRAELDEEGANEHIHKLSRKYRGTEYDDATERVIVRVHPERVHSYGID
jgi:PPOX class probable F420-dependent enzyme